MNLCTQVDLDGKGTISREEFHQYVVSGKLKAYLRVLGLDIRDAEAFFNLMADTSSNQEVEIETFVDACLRLKGMATALDLQSLIFETKRLSSDLTKLSKYCVRNFESSKVPFKSLSSDSKRPAERDLDPEFVLAL
mmetsp:Transcript_105659/g.225550  ORF Transcript_105659/g.225550 Transcript_105659/m.225550 type:complete len:136 (+) Transcript_105659:2-409(+)